jgi:hypothetical protein
MSLRSLLHQCHAASARVARALLALCIVVAVVASVSGVVPFGALFSLTKPTPQSGLGSWWLRSLTATLVGSLFTSIAAVVLGALLGILTSRRYEKVSRTHWYSGAIRRGLELTGALPSVIFCGIWLSAHPGQALPALMVITSVQQAFEVGARVKAMLEAPDSAWNALRYELTQSAGQIAVTLASGEIALIVLGLSGPNYATWASSAASYLCDDQQGVPTVLALSLCGTFALPACLVLAGSARPAAR